MEEEQEKQIDYYEMGFDAGYNFALNSEAVRALVEALTQIANYGKPGETVHITASGIIARFALKKYEAFQKARDAQKAEGEK